MTGNFREWHSRPASAPIEPSFPPLAAAQHVSCEAATRAEANDEDGAFPGEDIAELYRSGLLHAPFPVDFGGRRLGTGLEGGTALRDVLTTLGYGSLALGRLYEGHVNAVVLVARYGTPANLELLLREADAGRPSGVWMAGDPLHLEQTGSGRVLAGRKILASGAGHFRRPLVAANDQSGASIMLLPDVGDGARADASGWTAHGMRATSTGTVDFSGISVAADEVVGRPGDYLRSPYFRGGAWRVLAVQLGGVLAVLDHYRIALADSPHRDHPLQLARFGEAAIAAETARLWVQQACATAEGSFEEADAVDAYVDLARNAFEAAALRLVVLAQKAVGLKAFVRPNPLERVVRDLTTYLRQPALDVSLMAAGKFLLGRRTIG